ncbi:DNA polymerase beta superfamily protein [Aquibacillus salsiterrae]|uniref:Nucleotidyltransferase domain-containing protein n=1 Tax=Aquibacillus salsiterrae TaxID=2950439 RepID=A0A9X4AE87_9BACI|nr:nucleotidyltransferase domain-containing protein [Aquibacillus salsiterrae]MDC3416229.1 nucleotidyltransferase domain-containing protein [Aquibacillus salsiterrae]
MSYTIQELQPHTIYQVVTGSQSYGLATPHSDIDQKAIVILPLQQLFTLNKEWETQTFHQPDIEFHSLKKAMNLFLAQNPTMLELLFVPEEMIIKQTTQGEILRKHRQLFLSKKCYYSFAGYAKDQLTRIKSGLEKTNETASRFTTDNVKKRLETCLSNQAKGFTIKNIYLTQNGIPGVELSVSTNQITLSQLHKITTSLSNLLRANTNKQKAKMPPSKLSKHAMHLFRLLHMAIELLETGELIVNREKDKEFLLAIKNGEFRWEELFVKADRLMQRLEMSKTTSRLQETPPTEEINRLYQQLMTRE